MAKSVQIKKIAPWMERLADLMIAYPGEKADFYAKEMQRSTVWISIVKNSDTFIDYWRERSQDHSEAVTFDVKAKAYAAAEMALDQLHEKLEMNADVSTMGTGDLLEVIDVMQKRFGTYGAEARSAPQINLNLGLVTAEQLAQAREKLRSVQSKVVELKAIDHDASSERSEQRSERGKPGEG